MGWWLLILWVVVFGTMGALIAPRKGWTSLGGFVLSATFGIFGVAYLATREDIDPTLEVTAIPAVAPRRSGSTADAIRDLEELWEEGLLTDEEYEAKRTRLLARL